MRLNFFGRAVLAVMISASALFAGPQDELKKAVSKVLHTLDSKKPKNEKRQIISEIYHANFDLDKMASNTLKSDYRRLDDEQKKQFAERFGRFVLEFYLDKIDKYDRNKIEFVGEEVKGSRATVMTLLEYQGKMAKVNYMLAQKDDRWLVYDFEVEGVRLSSTYRSQFAKVLKEKEFDGLMGELNKLLAKYKK